MSPTDSLARHQWVRVSDAQWTHWYTGAVDKQEQALLRYWQAEDFPLIVGTQQPHALSQGTVALGLSAPLAWNKCKLRLQAFRSEIQAAPPLPQLGTIAQSMGQARWAVLDADLNAQGVSVRVYGSHAWQYITQTPYVTARSDLDLLLPVQDEPQALWVVRRLSQHEDDAVRIDGELVFPDGSAVAWREWQAFMQGNTRSVLVKTLTGARLENQTPFVKAGVTTDTRMCTA